VLCVLCPIPDGIFLFAACQLLILGGKTEITTALAMREAIKKAGWWN
jgi:hypothetical protein